MSNLSAKDKLKLKLSSARIERWNRERHKPVDNSKPRCQSIVFGASPDKPEETILPDRLDSVHRMTDGHKMRLPCGKLTLLRNGDNFSDYHDAGYTESPRDPIRPKSVYRARPDSPFKRAGKSASAVIIVRK